MTASSSALGGGLEVGRGKLALEGVEHMQDFVEFGAQPRFARFGVHLSSGLTVTHRTRLDPVAVSPAGGDYYAHSKKILTRAPSTGGKRLLHRPFIEKIRVSLNRAGDVSSPAIWLTRHKI